MKITITHCHASIDPSATIPEADFPAFIDRLEKAYTAAITAEYPEADVWYVIAEPCGNGIDIDCDDSSGDIAMEIAVITGREFERLIVGYRNFTVSIRNRGGDPSDLQTFQTLAEARAFAAQEKRMGQRDPDCQRCGWEWSISDETGAHWPTEETA
jgi:hypothetical protein